MRWYWWVAIGLGVPVLGLVCYFARMGWEIFKAINQMH